MARPPHAADAFPSPTAAASSPVSVAPSFSSPMPADSHSADAVPADGAAVAGEARVTMAQFFEVMNQLDEALIQRLNPDSKDKTLMSRLGNSKKISLDREQKNYLIQRTRTILATVNQFAFDWKKYGPEMPDRDFTKAVIALGEFREHLKEFRDRLVKSETLKEQLDRVEQKMRGITMEALKK